MNNGYYIDLMSFIIAMVVALIILGFGLIILWRIYKNVINMKGLISEPQIKGCEEKASLSRFQFLIFTFVVAGLLLTLSIESGQFVNIPENVLWLIGISGGSYVTSKVAGGAPSAPPTETDKDK